MVGVNFNRLKNGSLVLIGGEIITQSCGFLRNLVVARSIQPEDFGIAAAIATAASLIEIVAGLDVGRFLTRKQDEYIDDWLGVAHLIVIVRGLISGIILVAVGGLIADFVKMPEHAWAFHLIGLLPLIRSFANHSMWVEQRRFNYRPFVFCQAIPQIVTLIAAFPVLYYIRDFRALLILTLLNAVIYSGLSHIITAQKYSLHISSEKFKELWAYSAPLWLDGMLMFCVLQGERIIVTREFGATMAGIYSVAFLLSWTPAAILGRFGQSLGIPHFSLLLKDTGRVKQDFWLITVVTSSVALGFVLTFAVAGSSIITFVFGDAYAAPALLIILMGGHYSFRILRIPPTIIALASGHTKCIAQANLIRTLGVCISWFIAISTHSIIYVFVVALIFEALAGLWLFIAVRSISGFLPWTLSTVALSIIAATILGAYWSDTAIYQGNSDILNVSLGLAIAILGTTLSFSLLIVTRRKIAMDLWRKLKKGQETQEKN